MLLTVFAGFVLILMSWLKDKVLLLQFIGDGGGAFKIKCESSQASQLQGDIIVQVSFEAFQKLLVASVISAPIQILDKVAGPLIVPFIVS